MDSHTLEVIATVLNSFTDGMMKMLVIWACATYITSE